MRSVLPRQLPPPIHCILYVASVVSSPSGWPYGPQLVKQSEGTNAEALPHTDCFLAFLCLAPFPEPQGPSSSFTQCGAGVQYCRQSHGFGPASPSGAQTTLDST
eukprot:270330-Chlamydomonas_euryale.AAC.1